MNWGLLLFLGILAIGFFFMYKKMKVGKDDWEKLKKKIFKKKISPEQEAFNKGQIIFPIDKRDYENIDNFKEDIKGFPKLSKQLGKIDEEFKKWKPLENQMEETN